MNLYFFSVVLKILNLKVVINVLDKITKTVFSEPEIDYTNKIWNKYES